MASPTREEKLHSILNRGIDVLRESFEKSRSSSPQSCLGKSSTENKSFSLLPGTDLQDEVADLQVKISRLETMLSKRAPKCVVYSKDSKTSESPLAETKELLNNKRVLSRKGSVEGGRTGKKAKTIEKQRRENDSLKRQANANFKSRMAKLQRDYNELEKNYERSESLRRDQKKLIQKLQAQLKAPRGKRGSSSSHNPVKVPGTTQKRQLKTTGSNANPYNKQL